MTNINELEVKLPGGVAAHFAGPHIVVLVSVIAMMGVMMYVLHTGLEKMTETIKAMGYEQRVTNILLVAPQEKRPEVYRELMDREFGRR